MRAIAIFAALTLSACGSSDGLRDLRSDGAGPEEFTVLPVGPLTLPEQLTLPPPTPNGTNLTDPNPIGDAVAALGGRPSAQVADGIPAQDAALVAAAGRNGVDPAIRQELAAADAQFRGGAGQFAVLSFLRPNRYFNAYAGQALDAYATLDAYRAAGIATPSAPPRAD